MADLPERTTYTVIVLKERDADDSSGDDRLESGSAYTFDLTPRVPKSPRPQA